MHVKIIEGCIVCRQCECQAPDVFNVAEKAHSAQVVNDSPSQDRESDIIRAVKGCPVHVIKLKRDPKSVRSANLKNLKDESVNLATLKSLETSRE